MNKAILAIIVAVLVAGGLWFVLSGGDDTQVPAEETTSADVVPEDLSDGPLEDEQREQAEAANADSQGETIEVSYTANGFEPSQITVSSGDTVVWTNNSGGSMWVASDDHPVHSSYPGFDQLAPGQSYSFTFNQSGTWGYHNHDDHLDTGTVIVQ